jgi:hypothetical protein
MDKVARGWLFFLNILANSSSTAYNRIIKWLTSTASLLCSLAKTKMPSKPVMILNNTAPSISGNFFKGDLSISGIFTAQTYKTKSTLQYKV